MEERKIYKRIEGNEKDERFIYIFKSSELSGVWKGSGTHYIQGWEVDSQGYRISKDLGEVIYSQYVETGIGVKEFGDEFGTKLWIKKKHNL